MSRAERIRAATEIYNIALRARFLAVRSGDPLTILEAGERLREAVRALGGALVSP